MAKGPEFTRFFVPLLQSLREMGGSASSAEATDAVIEREKISEAELEKTLKSGQSRIRNQIAWARMYLVNSGHLDSSTRGVWRLTERGLNEDLTKFNRVAFFKNIHSLMSSDKHDETGNVSANEIEAIEVKEKAHDGLQGGANNWPISAFKSLFPRARTLCTNSKNPR
jgi:restriction system protein